MLWQTGTTYPQRQTLRGWSVMPACASRFVSDEHASKPANLGIRWRT